jgi:hypothetical protein
MITAAMRRACCSAMPALSKAGATRGSRWSRSGAAPALLRIARMITVVGGYPWRVPIFLFRNHADVEAYLHALARDDRRRREIFGRFGSDFIGIALDNAGEVARFIAGEAKWRHRLTDAVVES